MTTYFPRRLALAVGLFAVIALLASAPAFGQTCDAFSFVPSPSPDPNQSVLTRVAGASSADAWALGQTGSFPNTSPFLLYWDGAAWAQRSVPALPAQTTLTALGATPDGDTWLGGEGPGPLQGMKGNPVLARARDGAFGRVDEVVLPPQTVYPHWPRGGTPIEIDGTSASDVWVALEAQGNGDATGGVISSALHFDGDDWTETQLPRRANFRSHPRGIEAIAPDDVWVVGYGRSVGSPFFGEVFHYDGSSWSYVPTPLEHTGQVFFLDVSASGPDDVWVVGYINYTDPIYLHWDGSGWTVVPGPTSAPPIRVVALAPDNAWASPYSLDAYEGYFHWDGTAWTEVPGPTPPGATDVRRGTDLAKVGPCEAWSVGHYTVGSSVRTLTERLGGGGCAQSLAALLDDPTPAPGDVVTFTVTVTNNDSAPARLDLWLDADGPISRTIRLGTGTLPAGATVTRQVPLRIPGNAPSGHYDLALHVGTFPDDACDTVGLTLDVQAARAGGGGGGAFEVLTPGGDLFAAAAQREPGVNVAPNPFSRRATVTLDVAELQHVRAEVYDGLGRRVAVLHDGPMEGGAHALVFDGSALPAGVYVVRVTGETFSAARRGTLVR